MIEKVREPLTRFLFDSLKSKREIDESFIAEVIEIVVNALGLNEYVRGYKIENKPWNGQDGVTIATYNIANKKIIFKLKTALEFYQYNSKRISLDNFEKVAFIYDKVISTLLHELEHANQLRKIKLENKDLEGKILEYSNYSIWLIEHFDELLSQGLTEQKIYNLMDNAKNAVNKYYNYNPIERLAESYSHKTMATILKEIGTLPNISYYEYLKLFQNYIKGYIEGVTPTKFYFKMLGLSKFWPRIEENSKTLDFESRVSLGLPISEEEYASLEDATITLERVILK